MYVKFLNTTGQSPFQNFAWPLPTDDGPGEWLPAIEGTIEACATGYHAATEDNLTEWIRATAYEVESQSEWIGAEDKAVTAGPVRLVRKLNWDDRVARLYACRVAEDALPIFEKKYPDDKRPRQAIEVARRYAEGSATADELAAAEDAAWAAWAVAWAARAAAEAAARAAADAAATAAAADAAATAAAADAAADAARAKYNAWLLETLNADKVN